jgi:hypothetical protein
MPEMESASGVESSIFIWGFSMQSSSRVCIFDDCAADEVHGNSNGRSSFGSDISGIRCVSDTAKSESR